MNNTYTESLDYSSVHSGVRYAVFENCMEKGLTGDELTAEYHHQLRTLIGKPLAEACIANASEQSISHQPLLEQTIHNESFKTIVETIERT